MPIDPSIALGFRPPQINLDVPSPIHQFGQMMSLRGLMEQSQVRQAQLQNEQLEQQQRRLQNAQVEQAQVDAQKKRGRFEAFQNLFQKGKPAPTLDDIYGALGLDGVNTVKEMLEAQAKEHANRITGLKSLGSYAGAILQNPTSFTLRYNLGEAAKAGLISQDQAERLGSMDVNDPNVISALTAFRNNAMTAIEQQKFAFDETNNKQTLLKATADTQKAQFDAAEKQREGDASRLYPALARGPEAFAVALSELPAERRAIFEGAKSPMELMQRVLSPEKFVTTTQAAATAAESARHNLESERLTRVGQLMNDARARELAAEARQARLDVAANKPPTEAQHTVAGYASRMDQAEKTFDAIPTIGVRNTYVPDWAMTTEGQQFDQASRNFINATLRRESGAAISPSEFENAYRQYLPRPGNSPEVLKQKAENRAIIRESFKSAAGKAYESPEQLLEKAGRGTARPAGSGGGAAAPRINTKAEYDRLPSGAQYVDAEDGKTYTKR